MYAAYINRAEFRSNMKSIIDNILQGNEIAVIEHGKKGQGVVIMPKTMFDAVGDIMDMLASAGEKELASVLTGTPEEITAISQKAKRLSDQMEPELPF